MQHSRWHNENLQNCPNLCIQSFHSCQCPLKLILWVTFYHGQVVLCGMCIVDLRNSGVSLEKTIVRSLGCRCLICRNCWPTSKHWATIQQQLALDSGFHKNTLTCFAMLMPYTTACRCRSQSSCGSFAYFPRASFIFWLVHSIFTIKMHWEKWLQRHSNS